MSIIEWLNSNIDAGDAIIYGLIALVIWFILWHLLISKLHKKSNIINDLVEMGPISGALASLSIVVFLAFIALLFVASIQITIEFGVKMIFPLLLFWGAIIALFIFIVKKFKSN